MISLSNRLAAFDIAIGGVNVRDGLERSTV